jgi:hypothetical protein
VYQFVSFVVYKDRKVADRVSHSDDEGKARFLKTFKSNVLISTRVNPSSKALSDMPCTRLIE